MLETGEVKITRIEDAERGRIYYVVVQNKELKIMITRHAEGRLNRWSIDINKLFEAVISRGSFSRALWQVYRS